MVATMTDLNAYAAKHDDTDVLGKLVIYTIRDTAVHYDRLQLILSRYGLDDYLPNPPADSDIFRRVAKTLERTREDVGDNTYMNVLVRDVTSQAHEVVRRVVVETVDPDGQRLDYSEAWDLHFDKETSIVSVGRLPTWKPTEADMFVQDLPSLFRDTQNMFDGNAVRTLVKRVLEGKHAIPVRSTGGVEFVPRQNMNAADAIEHLASEIPEIELFCVPLPNEADEAAKVGYYLGEDTKKNVDRLMRTASEISRGEIRATNRRLATMGSEHRELKARLETYRELLEDDLGELHAKLDLLDKSLASALLAATGDD